jgi:hypothetical protein
MRRCGAGNFTAEPFPKEGSRHASLQLIHTTQVEGVGQHPDGLPALDRLQNPRSGNGRNVKSFPGCAHDGRG